jgi:hypothetical protein
MKRHDREGDVGPRSHTDLLKRLGHVAFGDTAACAQALEDLLELVA